LLAPLAAALGSIIFLLLVGGPRILYPTNPNGVFAFWSFGVIFGMIPTAIVTAIALPVAYWRIRDTASDTMKTYVLTGFFSGLAAGAPLLFLIPHPLVPLVGAISGAASGLCFYRLPKKSSPSQPQSIANP
jgi:hypothetical protein